MSNEDPSIVSNEPEYPVEPDDIYNNKPVFDAPDSDTFFANSRKDWNTMKYPEDSKPQQFVKNSTRRQPFYVRYTDPQSGEKFLKQYK